MVVLVVGVSGLDRNHGGSQAMSIPLLVVPPTVVTMTPTTLNPLVHPRGARPRTQGGRIEDFRSQSVVLGHVAGISSDLEKEIGLVVDERR
mgnify:CR=1 FL=1